jgi:hypothetical protein
MDSIHSEKELYLHLKKSMREDFFAAVEDLFNCSNDEKERISN